MIKHDTFDYKMSDLFDDPVRYNHNIYITGTNKLKQADDKPATIKRLHLFWDYRYATGSYKARKAGISRPSVMMRFGKDRFRLYGGAESNKLFDRCKDILKGWKARSKAEMRLLMPAYRRWLKENRLTAKNNPFSYWMTNVRKAC